MIDFGLSRFSHPNARFWRLRSCRASKGPARQAAVFFKFGAWAGHYDGVLTLGRPIPRQIHLHDSPLTGGQPQR